MMSDANEIPSKQRQMVRGMLLGWNAVSTALVTELEDSGALTEEVDQAVATLSEAMHALYLRLEPPGYAPLHDTYNTYQCYEYGFSDDSVDLNCQGSRELIKLSKFCIRTSSAQLRDALLEDPESRVPKSVINLEEIDRLLRTEFPRAFKLESLRKIKEARGETSQPREKMRAAVRKTIREGSGDEE
jgi:hypothetical protein